MNNKYVMIPGKMFDDEYFGCRKYYIDFLTGFGDVIQIIPASLKVYEDLLGSCKLLVLPGGGDINVQRYGAVPSIWTGSPDQYLEYYDSVLLPLAIKMKVPILGICRGFQSIVTYYGGTLTQNLPDHPQSETWQELVHPVRRFDIWGGSKDVQINSLHHQGAYLAQVPECFNILAYSTTDKICEAVIHVSDKVLGIQWHPEVLPFDQWISNWVEKLMEPVKI